MGDMVLTSDKELFSGTLLLESGRFSVDREELLGVNGTTLVDGLTNDIDDAAKSLRADRHLNGGLSVHDGLTTHETLGGVEGDSAHVVATQVLGDLKNKTVLSVLHLKCIENGREFTLELDVDDGTDNLGNLSIHGAEATCCTET